MPALKGPVQFPSSETTCAPALVAQDPIAWKLDKMEKESGVAPVILGWRAPLASDFDDLRIGHLGVLGADNLVSYHSILSPNLPLT